jgi:localization factor PodJL
MSTTEGFESQQSGWPGSEPGFSTPAVCGARDLRTLLDRIANQIADADRRQSEALGSMQDRLADLVREPSLRHGSLGSNVPASPDHIEARMSALALRPTGPSEPPALSATSFHEAMEWPAPAPLRSALADGGSGSFTRKDDHGSEVDPFDVVGEDRTQDFAPWDETSAEALTQICEREGLCSPSASETVQRGWAASGASPALEPVGHAPHDPGDAMPPKSKIADLPETARDNIERAWLEAKFADIAAKLEQSIDVLRTGSGVGALEERFERLEAKLGDALSEAATRSDLVGLKAIEAQVEDLANQFADVKSQFARLGEIEAELRTLGEHVSDERIAKLMLEAAPALPALEDLARSVAAQVVASLPPRDEGRANEAKQLDEVRSLVSSFISEQRQGEEQTAAMLDTMQQAMIRLLDRMDAVESGSYQDMVPAFPTYGEDHAYPAHSEITAALAPKGDRDMGLEEAHAEARLDVAVEHSEAQPVAEEHLHADAKEVVSEAAVAAAARHDSKRDVATGVERVERSKDSFIASARRAARQAAEAPNDNSLTADTDDIPLRLPGSPGAGPTKRAAAKRAPSRTMIAILIVCALGASFTVVNSIIRAPKPVVERQIDQAPANAGDTGNVDQQMPAIDREGEPGLDGTGQKGGQIDRDTRSGEGTPQRMIAPDVDSQRKLAGSSGRIIDDTGAPGIVLQRSAAITRPDHVVRLEQQHQQASLSARLGALQLPAPAVPAAMVPDTAAPGEAIQPITRQDATGVGARTVNEMPPALIGPTSLRIAAAKGEPSAEFEIGARFAEGKGVQQDLKQAIVWYQRSAAQGFAQAQYRLATMYERGLGVKADLARAKVWYQRAAEQGTAKAMHNLAVLSTGREGLPADYTVAAENFGKAATYGLIDSQFNLAVLYDSGLGVQKDLRQAYKWYALAARAGDEEAARRQEALRGKLSATDLALATAAVEAWKPLPIDEVANDPRVAGERWKLNLPISAN